MTVSFDGARVVDTHAASIAAATMQAHNHTAPRGRAAGARELHEDWSLTR